MTLDGVTLWRADAPAGVLAAATSRRGGVSDAPFDDLNIGRSTSDPPENVAENRRRVLAGLGLDPARLVTAGQVHGVRVAEAAEPGFHAETDGLVTRVAGLTLAVVTADCMSILLTGPGVVGAAHSGWRGTADGMPGAVLEAVTRLGRIAPGDIRVFMGPCIGPCCYRVGPEVAQRFPASAVRPHDDGPHVDLPAAARIALEAAGVRPEAIDDPPACTACHPQWLFSHRRDQGRTGRMWGLIALAS